MALTGRHEISYSSHTRKYFGTGDAVSETPGLPSTSSPVKQLQEGCYDSQPHSAINKMPCDMISGLSLPHFRIMIS